MKILKTIQKGTIGARDGMGLEEIDLSLNMPSQEVIDKFGECEWFKKMMSGINSSFGEGLIAICGDNGAGKTTFIENLQPHRSMVSREGTLVEHFYLKDSSRHNFYEHQGNIYEINILIDGVTGVSEAYLYENGETINDKGKETYDEHIIRIFGTKELFFNSIFCAQDSPNIASLKPAELRSIFYELRNLKTYEPKCEFAKAQLKENELKLSKIEGEISTLKNTVEAITADPETLSKLSTEKAQAELTIRECESDMKTLSYEIENIKTNLTRMEEKLKQNDELIEQKTAKEKALTDTEFQRDIELGDLEEAKETKLKNYEMFNEHRTNFDLQQKKLLEEMQTLQVDLKTATGRIAKLNNEISETKNQIDDVKKFKERTQKIVANKQLIEENVDKKKGHQKRVTDLLAEESAKHLLKSQLQSRMAEFQGQISLVQNSVLTKQYQKNSLSEKIKNAEAESARLELELQNGNQFTTAINNLLPVITAAEGLAQQDELESISTESKQILEEYAGYDHQLKTGGELLLKRISSFKEKILKIKSNFSGNKEAEQIIAKGIETTEAIERSLENKEEDIHAKVRELQNNLISYQNELSQISKENLADEKKLMELKEEFDEKFADKLHVVDVRLTEIATEVKAATGAIAELDKNNWDGLEKELADAEKNLQIAEDKLESLQIILNEKELSLAGYISSENKIQNNLNYKQQELDSQWTKVEAVIQKEKENIIISFNEKIETVKNNCAVKITEIKAEIERLNGRIDNTLLERNCGQKQSLDFKQNALTDISKLLEEKQKLITDSAQKITELQTGLTQKQIILDQIEGKTAKLKLIEREIKEWTFLKKAMDKTGIPVLKLEHSLGETQTETNDLLDLFESKFRVKFPTQSTTKDGKKIKEDLGIKVINGSGEEANAKNKSGGEKVWINAAIKLSIGETFRKRGNKDIQTNFLDESDDGLTVENAENYMRMVEISRKKSKIYQTFVITHKTFLSNRIAQKIIFDRQYGVRVVKEF